MSSRFEAVLAAIEDLKAAGIDARISELWRGSERVYAIVMLNVRELGISSSAGHFDTPRHFDTAGHFDTFSQDQAERLSDRMDG